VSDRKLSGKKKNLSCSQHKKPISAEGGTWSWARSRNSQTESTSISGSQLVGV